jgi:hypothetical protein
MSTKNNMLTDISAELDKEFGAPGNVKSSMKRHTLFILVKYCWMHDGKQK